MRGGGCPGNRIAFSVDNRIMFHGTNFQLVNACGESSFSTALAHRIWRNVSGWQREVRSNNSWSWAACAA